jgi:hypothetical protein
MTYINQDTIGHQAFHRDNLLTLLDKVNDNITNVRGALDGADVQMVEVGVGDPSYQRVF